MTLPSCVYRERNGGHGELFHCAHPQVVAPKGLVTAEVCESCALRAPSDGSAAAAGLAGSVWEWRHGIRTGRHWEVVIGGNPREVHECDVVIPYRTHLEWVPAAIDSMLWQRCVRCRIHMVNDDSPEDDAWLRRRYARHENIVWYRNHRNVGPYRSVHQVWPHVRPEYFAVQDSDDVSLPNRLWFGIEALERSGAEIFAAAAEQFLDPSVPPWDTPNTQYAERRP